MTWETEDVSDAQSHSQMTTDTYGYGYSEGNDQSIIWSDDPERAYFKSMIQGQEDHSLLGDSTVHELLEGRGQGRSRETSGRAEDPPAKMQDKSQMSENQNPIVDSSGLSYYDTDAEDDTIGKIEADVDDHGWFAMRRENGKKQKQPKAQSQKNQQQAPVPTSIPTGRGREPPSPGPRMAYNLKSPISALSPQDKAGEGMGQNQPYAVPNPNLVPSSPGNRPVAPSAPADGKEIMADLEGYGEDGKIIPGYIFVTSGHSSAVQTKNSPKGSKNGKNEDTSPKARRGMLSLGRQGTTSKAANIDKPQPITEKEKPKKFTKKELTDDTDDISEQRRRRKYCLCKIGIFVLMLALIVGIAMLALVFKSKREDDDPQRGNAGNPGETPPTMPPNFFMPAPASPTGTPTSPPRPRDTLAPTAKPTNKSSASPTITITDDPTANPVVPTEAPTVDTMDAPTVSLTNEPSASPTLSPTVSATESPTATPTISPVESVRTFLVSQFPESAPALEDTTSAQFRALQWIAQDIMGSRRIRGRQLQEETMDWRLVQRWTLAVLFFSTGGNDVGDTSSSTWRSSSGWLQLADECQWDFVQCNESGEVRDLVIQDNSLVGTIPPEIGLLAPGLLRISFNRNELEGSLPTTLGSLTNIFRFTVLGSQLSGSLPTEMGNMSSLEFLALSRNLLNGPIPSELGKIVGMRTIDFAHTNMSGTLPTELGRLSDLEFVSLGSSSVSGTIPTQLGDLPLFNTFKVARTDLVGPMPNGICNRPAGELDIKADCQEVDCPCCVTCCVDGGGCSGTTPSPTISPTRNPTAKPTPAPTVRVTTSPTMTPTTSEPTAAPTSQPTKSPTLQPIAVTSEPTDDPSDSPTQHPTKSPTAKPTAKPTPQPTPKATTLEPTSGPTPVATIKATPAPTIKVTTEQPATPAPTACEADIFLEDDCYVDGDDIVVFFQNCNARLDDWIGVYVTGRDFSSLDEPIAWVWTAGDQFEQSPVPSGNITFFQASGNGLFQVVLARNRPGPPYEAYAVSNEFRLAASC